MIGAGADGVIIGSAIIKKIKGIENKNALLNTLNKYAHEMKNNCKVEKVWAYSNTKPELSEANNMLFIVTW